MKLEKDTILVMSRPKCARCSIQRSVDGSLWVWHHDCIVEASTGVIRFQPEVVESCFARLVWLEDSLEMELASGVLDCRFRGSEKGDQRKYEAAEMHVESSICSVLVKES